MASYNDQALNDRTAAAIVELATGSTPVRFNSIRGDDSTVDPATVSLEDFRNGTFARNNRPRFTPSVLTDARTRASAPQRWSFTAIEGQPIGINTGEDVDDESAYPDSDSSGADFPRDDDEGLETAVAANADLDPRIEASTVQDPRTLSVEQIVMASNDNEQVASVEITVPTVSFDAPALSADVLGSTFVTLFVGPERKQFAVHQKLLCDNSEFFKRAFASNFSEGITGIMELPEDDPFAMNCFITFLYGNGAPIFKAAHLTEAPTSKTVIDFTKIMCNLIALADKICVAPFMNLVVDYIRDYNDATDTLLNAEAIAMFYAISLEGSMIRKYCAATIAYIIRCNNNQEHRSPGAALLAEMDAFIDTPDLMKDVMKFLSSEWYNVTIADPRDSCMPQFNACYFHTHKEGERCSGRPGTTHAIPPQ